MKGVQAAVLGGSALVLLILALRLTLKDHLPRRLFPALWCTAAIRFLLPVEIPTRLSVWNLLRGHGGAADRAHCVCAAPLPAALCGADRVRRRNGDGLAAAALVRDRSAACRVFCSRLCLHDAPVPSPAHSAAAVRRRAA